MAMKQEGYPWPIGASPNMQLAYILADYFNDVRIIEAAIYEEQKQCAAKERL